MEQSRFSQVHHIAVAICQNLKFNMSGTLNKLFQINAGVAEGGFRFTLGAMKALLISLSFCTRRMPRPPPPAVALDDDRVGRFY